MYAGRRWGIILAVAIFLVACEAPKVAQTNQSAAPRVVRVGILAFPGYAPLYLAAEERRCDAFGIQLQLVETEGQSALDGVMAKGEADVATYANTSLAFAAAAGVPIRAFLTLDQSQGADGVVASESVKSLQDMATSQTKFAADETDVTYFLFMAIADRQGLKPSNFNHLPLKGQDGLAAFLAGQVDAVGLSEPGLRQALQRPGAHVLVTSKDAPGIISDVFVAPRTVIETRSDDLVAFSRCWYDTIARMNRDPETAVPIMSKRLGIGETEMRALMTSIAWPKQVAGRSYLLDGGLRDSLQFTNDFYSQLGQLTNKPASPNALISDAITKQLP